MYITVKIRWKISGNLDDIKLPLNNLPNKDIIIPGVISFNENSLEFGNETIPGLTYHITNPVQFWTPPV